MISKDRKGVGEQCWYCENQGRRSPQEEVVTYSIEYPEKKKEKKKNT